MRYRVTVADKETGAESTESVTAATMEEAAQQCMRMGYVVGGVQAYDHEPGVSALRSQGGGGGDELILAELRGLRADLKKARILRYPIGTIAWGIFAAWICISIVLLVFWVAVISVLHTRY